MTKSLIIALALGVSGCNAAEPDADPTDAVVEATDPVVEAADPVVEDAEVAKTAPEVAATDPADNSIRIRITGFECGDNCYLDYTDFAATDAEPQSALCSVGACEEWFSMQEMPPEFAGRSARITLGKGKQYDNAGNVMSDDFAEITGIVIDPVE